MKYVTLLFVVVVLGTILFSGVLVFAGEPVPQIRVGSTCDLVRILNRIITFFIRIVSIIAVVMVIYSGFLFMTGAGNEDKIGTAKKLLLYVAIGIVVVALSYSVVPLVTSILGGSGSSTGSGC